MSIKVAFKFANWDNAGSPVLEVPASTSVLALKRRLLAEGWPATYGRPAGENPANIMLIAFGKVMGDDAALSGLPTYDWPTPVHVVLKAGAPASAAVRPYETGPAKTVAVVTSVPPPREENSCCCVIS
jgi:hypothetical protein